MILKCDMTVQREIVGLQCANISAGLSERQTNVRSGERGISSNEAPIPICLQLIDQ